jgi:adenylate cyclase
LSDVVRRGITVLLVDDQALIGEAVRRMLVVESDIRFHFCSDPKLAVVRALEVAPTVILQDLVMPQVDGMELVKAYRAEPRTRDVPLIVLSTKEDPKVKVEAFANGANDYLVKLPDRLELVARIRYHSRGYINLLERNEAFEQLGRRNAFIRDTFGRYVSDAVVESLLESPTGLELGGESRDVTILMADLRGFTGLSERLGPAGVVQVLNTFLSAMTDVIMHYGGTINEFIGDSILAIFNAPLPLENHTAQAVACAVAMQNQMEGVNAKNVADGLPKVAMGIGVHAGTVIAGNIGSMKRAKYGIVGGCVNMTARVESFTVGDQILISNEALQRVGSAAEVVDSMRIMAKGLAEPIDVHDVIAMGPPWNVRVPRRVTGVVPLLEPVHVHYRVLAGKTTMAPPSVGAIVAISDTEADILADESLATLTDVRMQLVGGRGGDFYAKVVARRPDQGSFAVRFTSIPDAIVELLRERTVRTEPVVRH